MSAPGRATATRQTLWLSCHVEYACRHSGACCRAGWPLPVEARVVGPLADAVRRGAVCGVDRDVDWLEEFPGAPEGMAGTLRIVGGACVFHVPRRSADDGSRHCAVHDGIGHEALPSSCQHFPRVCVVDDSAVRVTLSHFCPTAASMLVEHDDPITVVSGPPAVLGRDIPEGLDVRSELPPRLTASVLMDRPGFEAWERHVVDVLAGPGALDVVPELSVARVRGDARRLSAWRPGLGVPLVDAVRALSGSDPNGTTLVPPGSDPNGTKVVPRTQNLHDDVISARLVAATCRPPWTWPAPPADVVDLDAQLVAPEWRQHSRVVRRFLAAKAFGAWVAHQANATTALAEWLRLCLSVLRVECVRAAAAANRPLDRALLVDALRQADLLLVHYGDASALRLDDVRG